MSIEVKIPPVGESISSGVVSVWHKKSGEHVNAGDALFTLETDKVSTEIVAEQAGVLETKVPEGQDVKIGEVVATIDDSAQAPSKKSDAETKPEPKREKEKAAPTGDRQESTGAEVLSPAVRRIVEEEKLDVEKISGTGKGGRPTKGDALTAAQDRGSAKEKIDNRQDRQAPAETGLVVPVVRDADKKSFADIELDIAGFAVKAREGKLRIEDLQGGTFTISNGGVYGSLLSTPILNPPQSGILGLHKIMERPVAVNGKVEVRPMMYLALSYDHRAIDGKEAVGFLIKVKECIEDPKKLPLDF